MVGSTATSAPLAMSKIAALPKKSHGFSLIELMVTMMILAIIAAIAYPNYTNYVKRTKRVDMMSRLQNIASNIESNKIQLGKYDAKIANKYVTNEMQANKMSEYYTVVFTANAKTKSYELVAQPKGKLMQGDGNLSLNSKGVKCHHGKKGKKCGTGKEWQG